jgi:hypothetical protein
MLVGYARVSTDLQTPNGQIGGFAKRFLHRYKLNQQPPVMGADPDQNKNERGVPCRKAIS